mgnify:CR=1 FL=1
MAKQERTSFICTACQHEEPKWLGRCPACGAWNTFEETKRASTQAVQHEKRTGSLPLSGITTIDKPRFSSGIEEVDRVLGGGIVPGMSVLIGGEPGIGKSTLLMSLAGKAETTGTVLYVSGEESPQQIKMRADRLGIQRSKIELLCTNDLNHVLTTLEKLHPVILIVDSIQTLISHDAGSIPGTANQIKYCALEFAEWGRNHDTASFLVAHVTKDGMIAGPKAAEHIVDVVLMFEQNDSDARFLRSSKNRFGSVDEVGLFLMGENGLEEIADSSGYFLGGKRAKNPVGVAVAATWEGSRCLLVEIQALTVPGKSGFSRVYSERIDVSRVSRIAAILEKHTGIAFSDQDIYINVAGGIRLSEPGIDLALSLALYSARVNLDIPATIAYAGELSLAGEVRSVRRMKQRSKTAQAMGFPRLLGPADVSLSQTRQDQPAAPGNSSASKAQPTAQQAATEDENWVMVPDIKACIQATFE